MVTTAVTIAVAGVAVAGVAVAAVTAVTAVVIVVVVTFFRLSESRFALFHHHITSNREELIAE